MGIPLLVHGHENINARLPLRLTMQVDDHYSHLETCSDSLAKQYRQMGQGSLKSIGIDGSVILHSCVHTDETNRNKEVNIEQSIQKAFKKIKEYVEVIITFFKIYNNNNNENDDKDEYQANNNSSPIILNFVVDGYPPQKKNRKWREPDAYSQMSLAEKKTLYQGLIDELRIWVNSTEEKKGKGYKIKLITNALLSHGQRGEGEMALYTLCRSIYRKHYTNDPTIKNVIVSNDSDVTAMMILLNDPTTVLITPSPKGIYISNLPLISEGLGLNTFQLHQYVIMHVILFGSDYNLGLMTCATESKQKVIYKAVKENADGVVLDIEQVAVKCRRKKMKACLDHKSDNNNNNIFLSKMKQMLIYEGMMAVLYYASIGDPKTLYHSPNIYKYGTIAKRKLPFLSFSETEIHEKNIKKNKRIKK